MTDANPSTDDVVLQAWMRDAQRFIESGVATELIAVCPVALVKICLELQQLRSILSEAAPVGIETNCDECGGDNDKCGEWCWVHRTRAAGINADTDEPMEWV